jgi:hypothetical protein
MELVTQGTDNYGDTWNLYYNPSLSNYGYGLSTRDNDARFHWVSGIDLALLVVTMWEQDEFTQRVLDVLPPEIVALVALKRL